MNQRCLDTQEATRIGRKLGFLPNVQRTGRLGVTVCRVIKVEGSTIHVAGLDAIDGTPIVDIKPWMVEFGPRGDISQPSWSTELMKGYW
jgi:tRNA (Thr-GGU) A37 N-methylase